MDCVTSGKVWVRFLMSSTNYDGMWGSGGIAPFILNRGARLICQRQTLDPHGNLAR